ncbi:rhamnose ABC transporter substrate-binding protein, partial [Nocardioides sp. CCNWLW212]
MQNRLGGLAALTLVAGLALTACGGDDSSGDSSDTGGDNTSVTFIPKNLGNAYFDTSNAGGKKAV